MDPAKLADLLNTYGAWGMVVILIAAIAILWRYQCKMLETRHAEFKQVLEETTKALGATARAQEDASKTLSKATQVLEATQKTNSTVLEAIRHCQQR